MMICFSRKIEMIDKIIIALAFLIEDEQDNNIKRVLVSCRKTLMEKRFSSSSLPKIEF